MYLWFVEWETYMSSERILSTKKEKLTKFVNFVKNHRIQCFEYKWYRQADYEEPYSFSVIWFFTVEEVETILCFVVTHSNFLNLKFVIYIWVQNFIESVYNSYFEFWTHIF